jgi:hypothetical protein
MADTTIAAENGMPHRTAHRARKNALAADLDHLIVPSHTDMNRTPPKHISIGTRAATETKGQMESRDMSEQGTENRRNHNHRK